MMTRLRFTTHRRQSRRQIPTKSRTSRHDLERTVRLALRNHGEPMRWANTTNAWRPRRLILILDVSGSMESYARALLRFAHAAVVARNRVEVFTLGTRLTRVTRQLGNRDPDAALRAVTPRWSTGQGAPGWVRCCATSMIGGASKAWRGGVWLCCSPMAGTGAMPAFSASRCTTPPGHQRADLGEPVEGITGVCPAGRRHGSSSASRRPVRGRQHLPQSG